MLKSSSKAPSRLIATPQYNFGANLKALKTRMKAIESIGKITKAMKMVAASKMRTDVNRLESGKNFGKSCVPKILNNESYLQKKINPQPPKKTLLVPITSDKGLCGGLNSSVVREVKQMVAENRNLYKIMCVGDKGTVALQRPCADLLFQSVSEVATPLNFPQAASIAHLIAQNAEDCDNIVILYSHFKNVISSVVTPVSLLSPKKFLAEFNYANKHDMKEPEKDLSKHYYYELYLASQIYSSLLNNIASEQSARMSAMENASKNANEILDKLTLKFNKERQAKITMELCEIISGASAI